MDLARRDSSSAGGAVIYFIQAEIVGRIKIGFTSRRRFPARLSKMQTDSCVPLTVLATCQGKRRTESLLHDRFAAARQNGEWFDPVPELVRLVFKLQRRDPPPARQSRKRRHSEAATWLEARFQERPAWISSELMAAATAAGIGRNALFEARVILCLPKPQKKQLSNGQNVWMWRGPVESDE